MGPRLTGLIRCLVCTEGAEYVERDEQSGYLKVRVYEGGGRSMEILADPSGSTLRPRWLCDGGEWTMLVPEPEPEPERDADEGDAPLDGLEVEGALHMLDAWQTKKRSRSPTAYTEVTHP